MYLRALHWRIQPTADCKHRATLHSYVNSQMRNPQTWRTDCGTWDSADFGSGDSPLQEPRDGNKIWVIKIAVWQEGAKMLNRLALDPVCNIKTILWVLVPFKNILCSRALGSKIFLNQVHHDNQINAPIYYGGLESWVCILVWVYLEGRRKDLHLDNSWGILILIQEKNYTRQIKNQGCSPNTCYCNNCYSFLFFVCDSNYYWC